MWVHSVNATVYVVPMVVESTVPTVHVAALTFFMLVNAAAQLAAVLTLPSAFSVATWPLKWILIDPTSAAPELPVVITIER